MKLNILLAYALIVVPVVSGLGQTDTAQRRTSLTLATIYSTNASYYWI
ncbi:hypothetical protein [Parapedobacter composti]|nr:hypothetical protein [Parapedobacter composti]